MKHYTYIDPSLEEEKVLIYAKKRNKIVGEIEELVDSDGINLIGVDEESRDNETVKLNPIEVACFISENNKVYALVDKKRYRIKEKLYMLEEMSFKSYYVRLNQSCIANMKHISKFASSIGGALLVMFDNGYSDYIARRELKNVKERMGL